MLKLDEHCGYDRQDNDKRAEHQTANNFAAMRAKLTRIIANIRGENLRLACLEPFHYIPSLSTVFIITLVYLFVNGFLC